MNPDCIYCGEDAGAYDEHDVCVAESIAEEEASHIAAVDLFAGPGGWDVAARELELEPLGIEFDAAACETRAAAGLRSLQADVSALDPSDFAPVDLLIASPPCQAFSAAGKGAGRAAIDVYREAIARTLEGKPPSREELDEECSDQRAHLVLEPLRWALELRPRWIALEQVPPVLPLWEATAAALERCGYATWTGVVTAEQFGVPQTRRRAILLAELEADRLAGPPPTHQRYATPRRASEEEQGLFALEPERIIHPDDRALLPWVSMAEALGWGLTKRPSPPVMAKVGGTGGNRPLEGGSGARELLTRAREDGDWVPWFPTDRVGFPRRNDRDDGNEYRERDLRAASQPAFALTEKARSWTRLVDTGNTRGAGAAAEHSDRNRDTDSPAPTITSRADQLEWGEGPYKAPARTVRVTVEEAAVLQTFPADYPWQGTRTKQFEQVGNAVPPRLAEAILRHLLSLGAPA